MFGSTGKTEVGMLIMYRSPDGNDDEPRSIPMEPRFHTRADILTLKEPPPDSLFSVGFVDGLFGNIDVGQIT